VADYINDFTLAEAFDAARDRLVRKAETEYANRSGALPLDGRIALSKRIERRLIAYAVRQAAKLVEEATP
jgi:hypothetical protein